MSFLGPGYERVTNIEMGMGWFSWALWDVMDVEIKKAKQREVDNTSLLPDLPPTRRFRIGILGLDVAPGLQPQLQLAMEDQECLRAIGRKDETASGEMTGKERGTFKGSCSLLIHEGVNAIQRLPIPFRAIAGKVESQSVKEPSIAHQRLSQTSDTA